MEMKGNVYFQKEKILEEERIFSRISLKKKVTTIQKSLEGAEYLRLLFVGAGTAPRFTSIRKDGSELKKWSMGNNGRPTPRILYNPLSSFSLFV